MKKFLLALMLCLSAGTACSKHAYVRVTCYKAKTGSVTADGTKVTHRVIKNGCVAVSRDMLHKFPLGSRIFVEGYGYFWVKDTTASHIKNTIDILIHATAKPFMKTNVKVRKA